MIRGGGSRSTIGADGENTNRIIDNVVVNDISSDETLVEHHHHGGHYNNGGYDNNSNSNNNKKDDSFDFYVYSMSYQPEFCRENHEKFVGCQHYKENWEGQLTIHGLWPNVSMMYVVCIHIVHMYISMLHSG